MTDTIQVAVAVIINERNQVCISLRHKDAHQGGLWEFPGGKVEADETVEQALKREIKEELDIDIMKSRRLISVLHDYKDKRVNLHVYKVLSYKGEACGVEGQLVEWIGLESLVDYDFPAANQPIIKALQIPDKYLITGKCNDLEEFSNKLQEVLAPGRFNNRIDLVQLRLKKDSLQDITQTQSCLVIAAEICEQAGARLMLNLSKDNLNHADLTAINFSGFHVDSNTLKTLTVEQRMAYSKEKLFSASCHTIEELNKAAELNADFVVLSPVQKTKSHPEMDAMGWQKFSNLVERVSVPVFALGGVTEKDLATAWSNGAQGVAAISAWWK